MTFMRMLRNLRPLLALLPCLLLGPALGGLPTPALAQESGTHHAGGEANLTLPDLSTVTFLGGVNGHTLLLFGLVICVLGLVFGLLSYSRLRNLPVHKSMLEISELIYETCKTYLIQQGKFLIVLWVFISSIVLVYFGWLAVTGVDAAGNLIRGFPPFKVATILFFSLVGMAGSYAVAWFGIRINTFANSRTAFAALRGKPYPC
jgi:K(+)-stimulated pyrophosphate-energized sodium pump